MVITGESVPRIMISPLSAGCPVAAYDEMRVQICRAQSNLFWAARRTAGSSLI